MYPMKMTPPFKDYIWGGTRLKTEWGKKSDLEILAESWELSCHPSDPCIIANGEYAGKSLPETLEILGKDAMGTDCEAFDRFPLLP